jgi:hypothetical protein
MKWICALLTCLVFIAPARADETWLCVFPGLISPSMVRERMEVRGDKLIRDGQMTYQVVQSGSRALVAAYTRAEPPESPMTVGVIALDKRTGDFTISVMVPGSPIASKVVSGKCDKTEK